MRTLSIVALMTLAAGVAFAGDSEAGLLTLTEGPVHDVLSRALTADKSSLKKWAKQPLKSGVDKAEFCPLGDQQALGDFYRAWAEYAAGARTGDDLTAPNEAHAAARFALYQLMSARPNPQEKLKQALALAQAVAPLGGAAANRIAAELASYEQPPATRVRISGQEAAACYLRVVPKPHYPSDMSMMHVETDVIARLLISPAGDVVQVVPVQAHPGFRDEVTRTLFQWKFRPYYIHGQPVEIETTVTIHFGRAG